MKEQEKRIDQLQNILKQRLLSDLNETWIQTAADLHAEEEYAASEEEQKKTIAHFEKEQTKILAQLKAVGATDAEIAEAEPKRKRNENAPAPVRREAAAVKCLVAASV